MKGDWGLNEA